MIEVIRYDLDAEGNCTERKPVRFGSHQLAEAKAYVLRVRQAIDHWGDNSVVGLFIDGVHQREI